VIANSAAMSVPLRCVETGQRLHAEGKLWLRPDDGGVTYPIVDGIPLVLPTADERQQVAHGEWSSHSETTSRVAFYNRTDHHDCFCREQLTDLFEQIGTLYCDACVPGPSLELGSGKGALQGIGEPYVALDYSLSALQRHVDQRYQRVCASAELLPFFDATFSFIYSVAVLEHLHKPHLAFEEIDRVLAPGGVVFLLPAWHCVQYQCEGIPVRAYSDLDIRQKVIKATLPAREVPAVKALAALPRRVVRRAVWALAPIPTTLRFKRLRPDYETFWMSDSDAAARLDSHEGALFFHSRGYQVASPGPSALRQLMARHVAVIARKPDQRMPDSRRASR
jgi:SAM-dependent methyltransferase